MNLINDAPGAPAAIGPYSQAVRTGSLLFCSGQIPINPASGKIEATTEPPPTPGLRREGSRGDEKGNS